MKQVACKVIGLIIASIMLFGCTTYKRFSQPVAQSYKPAQVTAMQTEGSDYETMALPAQNPAQTQSIQTVQTASVDTSKFEIPVQTRHQESTTVKVLMDEAKGQFIAGKYPQAENTLERALRIEPRNPRLWSNMARLRLAQSRANEAVPLAIKSNRLAGDNTALKKHNLRILKDAYLEMGQKVKAADAQAKLESL